MRDIAGIVGILVLRSGFMGMGLVLFVTVISTSAVLESVLKKTRPTLTQSVINKYDCKKVYKIPPFWKCNWAGKKGEMQTNVFVIPNVDIVEFRDAPNIELPELHDRKPDRP